MKVAIVHYWWITNRGGEAVVSEIFKIFPEADLFVHVADPAAVKESLGEGKSRAVKTSFIASLPFARKMYQYYLPLMPFALEQIDLRAYDLIISSESGPAKGVITSPTAKHVCYCHSPMRYIWDLYHDYIKTSNPLVRLMFPFVAYHLRLWDQASSMRVDHFIANSSHVAKRIQKFYRREAHVLHPPVDTLSFCSNRQRSNFYLCLGQLVGYKRIDLAVAAFKKNGLPLVVIGEGSELVRLKRLGASNIVFLGRQPQHVVKNYLETCKALVFPGLEDFGIVPVEAMAAGAPVVAYGAGGVLDSVVDRQTGILFPEQSVDSLLESVDLVESGRLSFSAVSLANHAKKFSRQNFSEGFRRIIEMG
jgi:glycosyltransferase involved in cell wall biosynthesis